MCNCLNADLRAENDELKKQVSALTQALETQNRENHPYIKELEAQIEQYKKFFKDANDLFSAV